MSGSLKILVIGSGSIGRRHHTNLKLLGVPSVLVSYQRNTAGQIEALLDDSAVSGVVIATATHIRTELILACARKYLPVYIEKPLAFTRDDLKKIYAGTEHISKRSMVGFMMRYHPLFNRLVKLVSSDVYRFRFTIGHDVTQWRQNWSFAESYAALPQGGGVLLDLCHELDMAACLFPRLNLSAVCSVGHDNFPGVDFSTDVLLVSELAQQGFVSMDYLSPVSTRTCTLFAKDSNTQLNFNTLTVSTNDGVQTNTETITFERNDMFLASMKDFLALVKGEPVSGVNYLPRLDLVYDNCLLVTQAWEQRRFTGHLSGLIA